MEEAATDWNKFNSNIQSTFQERLRSLKERHARAQGDRVAKDEEEQRAKEDRTPISSSEWIDNEYFSGSYARTMWPALKELFIKVVDRKIYLVVMRGATRYGKSYLGSALQGRSKYEVDCWSNPQRTLGIQDESSLLYLNMNVTGQKARDAYFNKLSAWIKSTPYFQKEFAPQSNVFLQLRFPKNVLAKYSGAQRTAAESEDLFFFVGDEANLYDVVEDSKRAHGGVKYDAAEIIDTEVTNRMQGTFMRADGTYPSPCKVIWICKETYEDSFMDRKDQEVHREGLVDKGVAMVIRSTEWGMKPMKCTGCNTIVDEKAYECGKCNERIKPTEYFYIRTPSRKDSARIITDKEEAKKLKKQSHDLAANEAPGDEQFNVIAVPKRYLGSATKKVPGALENFIRNMCGEATQAIEVFFREREPIYEAIREAGESVPGVKNIPAQVCLHPFSGISTNTKDGIRFIQERIAKQVKTGRMVPILVDGKPRTDLLHGKPILEEEIVWRPIINPGHLRYVGVDAGLSGDSVGIAMGHCCGWKKVLRYHDDENPVEEAAPVIWYDLLMRINPPPGGQIPFAAIRGLIYKFSMLGFGIAKITCDSFQHVALTQPLAERGYNVEVVSVDRTPDAYNFMHLAYGEERVSAYSYPPYEKELTELERIVTGNTISGRPVEKIDHPPNGKKDLSDAAAQVAAEVEMASAGLQASDMQPRPVARKAHQPMVEEHKQMNKYYSAFDRGDLVAMQEMEPKKDWEW